MISVKSVDSDEMPHSAAFHLGLHCLPKTLLGVSRIQWFITSILSINLLKFYILQITVCFDCSDSLHTSQQFFSHV